MLKSYYFPEKNLDVLDDQWHGVYADTLLVMREEFAREGLHQIYKEDLACLNEQILGYIHDAAEQGQEPHQADIFMSMFYTELGNLMLEHGWDHVELYSLEFMEHRARSLAQA